MSLQRSSLHWKRCHELGLCSLDCLVCCAIVLLCSVPSPAESDWDEPVCLSVKQHRQGQMSASAQLLRGNLVKQYLGHGSAPSSSHLGSAQEWAAPIWLACLAAGWEAHNWASGSELC